MPVADQAPPKKIGAPAIAEHLPLDEKVYAPMDDTCPAGGGGLRWYAETDVIIGEFLHSGKMISSFVAAGGH